MSFICHPFFIVLSHEWNGQCEQVPYTYVCLFVVPLKGGEYKAQSDCMCAILCLLLLLVLGVPIFVLYSHNKVLYSNVTGTFINNIC